MQDFSLVIGNWSFIAHLEFVNCNFIGGCKWVNFVLCTTLTSFTVA